MFERVLIANRGEIAVRVIRACHKLGLEAVAVYSQADRHAWHAQLADEAVEIGPPPASESYLRGDRLIEAARRTGCGAVHPGYGFLAENARFAQAVGEAGLAWIGPPPEAMRRMGDKLAARRTAQEQGVPVVPGAPAPLRTVGEAQEAAEALGYPVLLKAAAGGGGVGMRILRDPEELAPAFERARSEAQKSFGDPAVYLEKFIASAKHIEIQVFADAHGNCVWLGERECSIQRRHQKLIEETPAPRLEAAQRREMGRAAVALARACGYVGAGTVEFLYDTSAQKFYFLEVNARLQVEHPVTEMVTGLDLVEAQLRVAAGERLPFTQEAIRPQGAAIECRLYAEDPKAFTPATGTLHVFSPPSGEGVRLDSGVRQNDAVTSFYDPLLAKLIVHGRDRAQAIARMRRALDTFVVAGVVTNLAFHRAVMDDPAFRDGSYRTDFVNRRKSDSRPSARELMELAAAAALYHRRRTHRLRAALRAAPDGWPWPEASR